MIIQTREDKSPNWRGKYTNQECKVIDVDFETKEAKLEWLNPPNPADRDVPNPYTWRFES